VLFHTGIVLRKKFNEPEDVASGRMRPIHLEEIARRFPKITVLGAHCGNPEYQWAAEIARWNSNVFFDLSGSSLTKMQRRLSTFREIFWWTGEGERSERVREACVRVGHRFGRHRERCKAISRAV
jgi:predicted TIM-barrel fold metal-dependent hydrolase